MAAPRDPHEIDLDSVFPSVPKDQRKEMRGFLDDYCEIALRIFERLERERRSPVDEPTSDP